MNLLRRILTHLVLDPRHLKQLDGPVHNHEAANNLCGSQKHALGQQKHERRSDDVAEERGGGDGSLLAEAGVDGVVEQGAEVVAV